MDIQKPKMTPSRSMADALLNANIIKLDQLDAAAAIISSMLPKGNGTYNFSSDVEFLHTCLNHHVGTYFSQVLEPLVMSYHSVHKNGRLIADADIDNASIELTTEVMNEIGTEYRTYIAKYFGNDAGITSYIYTRIHDMLIDTARKFNDSYLESFSKKISTKKTSMTLSTELGELNVK
jgi:hypothetical protein